MKFGHLILRKIFKFVATRRQILRLKCTKFDFGWGSAPDPARGAYSAPPDLLVAFKGLLLREGRLGMVGGRESGGNERGGKRRGPPRVDSHPHVRNPENTLIAELI